MNTKKKVSSIIIAIVLLVALASILIFTYNFRIFSLNVATNKAISIAQNVRDGLTAHMVNGTMSSRKNFLNNIARHQNVKNFHILRTKTVIEQYGAGYDNENKKSVLEKSVLKTKTMKSELVEDITSASLSIAIPYIASSNDNPNCMQCHNAKEGDVLGVISMTIDISDTRQETIKIITQVLLAMIVIIFLLIIATRSLMKPYLKLFEDLEYNIVQAYNGDFSNTIDTNLTDEAGNIANKLNNLFEIYRFKNTIELDENKEIVYQRIIKLLQKKFNLEHFALFEVDNKKKLRKIVFDSIELSGFDPHINSCRALRTKTNVSSDDFEDICTYCDHKQPNFLCIDFIIDDKYSLLLHIESTKANMQHIKKYTAVINNYFNMAKPVIESKILLEKLKDTTLKDPLTTLYNRRFLQELMDSHVASRVKDGCIHSILMIDIDFFKKVNDTYGHNIGDEVIKRLASIMKGSIRDSDMPVRYGGEEFLILLINSTHEKTLEIANNIKNDFSKETYQVGSEVFSKTISIGISHYTLDTDKLVQCMKYADEALYVAKNNGRDQIIEYNKSLKG